jgi:hypothetical protein
VAVVPVSVVDAHTAGALEYAKSLAPQVIAVHLRASTVASNLEDQWAAGALRLPLVVIDAPDGDRTSAMRRALAALRRTEHTEQITLVIPAQARGARAETLRVEDLIVSSGDLATVRIQHAPAAE